MILIDANALVLLIVGTLEPDRIQKHRRTSIYDRVDYEKLCNTIGTFENLVILPNVWTEVDNLLNACNGEHKNRYVLFLKHLSASATEKYIASHQAFHTPVIYDLGLTDTLLLSYALQCDRLITADSVLADYAKAYGCSVYDLKAEKRDRLLSGL
jgi:hypothetical protein